MHASLRKELEARHSLLNLSVHDLVEEFARYRLELEAQLRKASEEKELAKTKKEKREKEERLKALLNAKYNKRQSLCKSRDSNRTLHSRRLIGAYILYFKELSSNNSRIFASVIGITRTQAIVLSAIIRHVYFKN
ncbi:hypothetical protein HBH64_245640 [Parastagonospora nodorum]|nr:hypothetical protein HBI02_245640 [Parastagonospora nodorum]KAH4300062.1 hypothetical protein HBI01_108600 [Parastagonospora nodorum]KAH4319410.1 hypothetical protein HBI00_249320 [Parastagonospora nodorum]KAH4370072.1 hypothetical protein HBH94_120900 [Parastagonospora nodorum]KAH4446659.1 hypothetical protein HBH90_208730 [Parastagonospora nodorum]